VPLDRVDAVSREAAVLVRVGVRPRLLAEGLHEHVLEVRVGPRDGERLPDLLGLRHRPVVDGGDLDLGEALPGLLLVAAEIAGPGGEAPRAGHVVPLGTK
jgi:hypothetical protein